MHPTLHTLRSTLAAVTLAALAIAGAAADTLAGRVVGVSDGDTVTVLDANKRTHKIRLLGIDSPEKKQPFGERAKQSLSDLVYDKQVSVEGGKQDRYGRALGKIVLDGQDINLEQVRRGMAWHYKQYARDQSPQDRMAYAEAETAARQQRVGLWQDAQPVPPWSFRREGREQNARTH
ncbi:MAG: Thermonuclease precursor [Pseudomonadota bacterium]